MGFFDEIKRLAHPYDDEDEFFDRGGPEEEQPGPPITPERRESFFTDEENAEQPSFGLPKPSFRLPRREKEPRAPKQEAPAREAKQAAPAQGVQGLMLAKPAEFADAAGIADSFVAGRTIVLDLGAAGHRLPLRRGLRPGRLAQPNIGRSVPRDARRRQHNGRDDEPDRKRRPLLLRPAHNTELSTGKGIPT